MTSITKEQWQKIEEELSQYYVNVIFNYKGHEVKINRVRVSESVTNLVVWIDGKINNNWGYHHILTELGAGDPDLKEIPTIINDVWRNRIKSKHSLKDIKRYEKINGKRWCKKMGIYDKHKYYEPLFPKSSVLVRQFKKLDGLELIKKAS
ncbi:hypothetical protein [Photobacterium piscicola]|uniref:hypothetical protein n=1 Tax=Photobacterium piscicola TaxID=1378299 RepID=UPI00373511B9